MGTWLSTQTGLVAELARAELDDINRLSDAIDELSEQISTTIAPAAPTLLRLPGCGDLTAAKIVAEVAGVERFKNEDAFARYVGVAPIPHWYPTGQAISACTCDPPDAATVSSTRPCTASPSPRSDFTTAPAGLITAAASTRETLAVRRCAR